MKRIAEKHVSTNVKPEHYPIVGKYLIGALKEVLGEAATPEFVQAWTEAFQFLANIFIEEEKKLMDSRAEIGGGWRDYREFVIDRKEIEAENIISLYLKPKDGGNVPLWTCGQYTCVRLDLPEFGGVQRNYSLSCQPNDKYFRITVKKSFDLTPICHASKILHDMNVGDSLKLTVPCGEFTLQTPESENETLVFLALGAGITPILPLAQDACEKYTNNVILIQGARNEKSMAFVEEISKIENDFKDKMVYKQAYKSPQANLPSNEMTSDWILSQVPKDSHFYFTGPPQWLEATAKGLLMNGVSANKISYEFFGPTLM